MARNPTISKTQEEVVRDFIFESEAVGLELPPQVWDVFIQMLDYKRLPSGALVSTDTEVKIPFGGNFDAYPDQYGPDGEELYGYNNQSTIDACSSESPEGDKVGNVLREEV